jgi:hypothetical protein
MTTINCQRSDSTTSQFSDKSSTESAGINPMHASYGPNADLTLMVEKKQRILGLIEEGSVNGPVGKKTKQALKELKELAGDQLKTATLTKSVATFMAFKQCKEAYFDKYKNNKAKCDAFQSTVGEVETEVLRASLKIK